MLALEASEIPPEIHPRADGHNYQVGHGEKKIEYVVVGADLAF